MAETKKMNVVQLTFIVAVNMMGSGIIMLPTNMAKVGAISLLSWVVTAVGSMAIAYCFAQLGVLCPRSGGMSAYSEEAHGKSSFFMAFQESFNRFPGFNYEVQGVYQERVDGRIKFYTYAVRQ